MCFAKHVRAARSTSSKHVRPACTRSVCFAQADTMAWDPQFVGDPRPNTRSLRWARGHRQPMDRRAEEVFAANASGSGTLGAHVRKRPAGAPPS